MSLETFNRPCIRESPHSTSARTCISLLVAPLLFFLSWIQTQKKLDKKNAEIDAKLSPYVAYSAALKAHRPRAWIGARKKVVWSRLFGEGNSNKSAQRSTGGD